MMRIGFARGDDMKKWLKAILPGIGMLCLILDPHTALNSASEAVDLCAKTVVTSLFPFFVLSSLLTSSLLGAQSKFLRPFGILCRMQPGTESLLLIGFLGGYPTGAQAISQACQDGVLDKQQAQRMLGFCCNAGPAFLFGICGQMFPKPWMPWLLWAVHILAAILTARLLPYVPCSKRLAQQKNDLSLPEALDRALKNTGRVCGWVILFRILIGFLKNWLLYLVPPVASVFLSGLLELTNGCLLLTGIENIGLRFLLASVFLAFGGLCVVMQTVSVTGKLGLGHYLRGKLMQSTISALLCLFLQALFFPPDWRLDRKTGAILAILMNIPLILFGIQKNSSISEEVGV